MISKIAIPITPADITVRTWWLTACNFVLSSITLSIITANYIYLQNKSALIPLRFIEFNRGKGHENPFNKLKMSNSEKKTQISVRFTSEQLKGIEEYQQSRILFCEHRADAVRELVDIAFHRNPTINKIMGMNPQHKAFLEVLAIPMLFCVGLSGILQVLNPSLLLVRLILISMSLGLIFIGIAFFDHYRVVLRYYYGR